MTLSSKVVTPVKTGVQCFCKVLKFPDSGFHQNDDSWAFSTFYDGVNNQRDKEKEAFLPRTVPAVSP
jgi:hypothetical protein